VQKLYVLNKTRSCCSKPICLYKQFEHKHTPNMTGLFDVHKDELSKGPTIEEYLEKMSSPSRDWGLWETTLACNKVERP
jgi:hypothetical protein